MSRRPRGRLPDWRPRTARQVGIVADLLGRYQRHYDEDTLPRGGRGIFYDVRPHGAGNGVTYRKPDSKRPVRDFGPMEAHPAAVQEALVLMRRAGIIPEHWVADQRAPTPSVPLFDESADEVAERIARRAVNATVDLDPQRGQPLYVEVLCEAADLTPRLARIADPFGVPVYSGAGFDGLKAKRAFASRAIKRDVPTVVLSVGDRDKHGEDAYVAAAEDAIAWAHGVGLVLPIGAPLDALRAVVERNPGRPGLYFYRLGLTAEQARDLDVLDADGKAEADAIPVPVLDRLLTDAIEALTDPACRERLREEEEAERERLPEAIREALEELT